MGNPVQKPILWDRDLVAKMWQIFQNASDTLASCLHLVYILFASCLREHPFATAQPLKTSAAAGLHSAYQKHRSSGDGLLFINQKSKMIHVLLCMSCSGWREGSLSQHALDMRCCASSMARRAIVGLSQRVWQKDSDFFHTYRQLKRTVCLTSMSLDSSS